MNKIKEWLKSHTKQAIAIAAAIVLIIAFAVAGVTGAFSKNAEPETSIKDDNDKQILDTVNKSVDANEHISDETKESTKETTESAQTKTETKPAETVKPDNTSNTSTGNKSDNKSSNNSGSNSGGTKPDTSKPKERVWVPEQGHYEEVWIENMVLVEITPAKTEWVYDYMEYIFAYDGYTTTSRDDCKNHGIQLLLQDCPSNYTGKEHYKEVTTPAVTEWQDQGKYEKKWVVDVPGHWE